MEKLVYQKLLTKGHIILGTGLSVLVFVIMSVLLRPFTFSEDPVIMQLQASFTAIPIACTFWFASHMFMLVLVDQRKRKAEGIENP